MAALPPIALLVAFTGALGQIDQTTWLVGFGAIWLSIYILGRILYRYASRKYEASAIHDLMKAVIGMGGPVGQHFRPLPRSPFVMEGLELVLPSGEGWVTTTARRTKRAQMVQFSWYPPEPERRIWVQERFGVALVVVVATALSELSSPENRLSALSERISAALSDTDRMKVDAKDLDVTYDDRPIGWAISARFDCQTIDSHTDRCVAIKQIVRMFPHPSSPSIVSVGCTRRLPCDSLDERAQDAEAFVANVRPVTNEPHPASV